MEPNYEYIVLFTDAEYRERRLLGEARHLGSPQFPYIDMAWGICFIYSGYGTVFPQESSTESLVTRTRVFQPQRSYEPDLEACTPAG